MRRRRLLIALLPVLAGLVLVAAGVGRTSAAFTNTTSNDSNSFSSRPDWMPPVVSGTVIAKTTGYVGGFIKQGGTYRVYANINDDPSSSPPAGVGTPTADVSVITSGQTATTLSTTGGPWSVQGTSYNYRSGSLTAGNPLSAGSKTWSLTAPDLASPVNTTNSTGLTVTVDNTAPSASNIAAANKTGGTQSLMEAGDTVTFTYSEQIDPESILTGWGGTSTNVTVREIDGGGPSNDTLQVWDSANTSQLPLGSVNLGRKDYNSTGGTVNFTTSTMSQSGGAITVTLGTPSGAMSTGGGTGNMAWTPSATAYDRAGNAESGTFTESDGDRDF